VIYKATRGLATTAAITRIGAAPRQPDGTDMELITTIATSLLTLLLYFGPTIVALCRNHRQTAKILLVNLLLGWTIVGLFVAFTWALSAARPIDRSRPESATSDYGERFFQNRNIARQPDGGAIVYPAYFSDKGYLLDAAQLTRYLAMRAADTRQVFPRALITIILAISSFLAFRKLLGPEHGAALAIIAFTIVFLVFELWFFVRRPKADFRAAFPDAPLTQDPTRSGRKLISSLLSFNFLVSAGTTVLCAGLIASVAVSAALHPGPITVRAHDGAILLIVLLMAGAGAAYFGALTFQHVAFMARHRRGPEQSDLDGLTGSTRAFVPGSNGPADGLPA